LGDNNPLVEFNKKFRALNEEKDAAEREAKAQRKAAGRAALKKLLSERVSLVEGRKAKNREEEAARLQAAMDSLEAESWGRVVSLVDVHGTVAAAAATPASAGGGAGGGGDKKKGGSDDGTGDIKRMKDGACTRLTAVVWHAPYGHWCRYCWLFCIAQWWLP
jgi:hypothetical protein